MLAAKKTLIAWVHM